MMEKRRKIGRKGGIRRERRIERMREEREREVKEKGDREMK